MKVKTTLKNAEGQNNTYKWWKSKQRLQNNKAHVEAKEYI